MNIKGGFGTSVCSYSPLSSLNLQWINTITSTVLMLLSGTSIQKSFLVPIFALQAPASIISWIKGEYGVWTAFLLLLVRLFLHIPGELELPFSALLIVLVAPYQILNLSISRQGKARRCYSLLDDCWILGFPAFFARRQLRKGI
ncbi:cold-regulated 413 inner membrane protein 1, chloroplastic isoform X4 [Daucus carota subsp. sativus]|uniref:cold-regulated 413 inner membrane protein 1, chloroplastic isoform X4 n=1 Tax=Daucus carota subsp. sativus TaxID=79200 RepID=UPI003083D1A3